MPLSGHLGALADGLGCSPLDKEAYPPSSHWCSASRASIQSLPRFGTALAARTETVLYPWPALEHRCASTHFGENQLAPSSIGISPLTTAHPPIFQHRSVRASTQSHRSFTLAMVRSLGFGSINDDMSPYQTCFRYGFSVYRLSRATAYESPAHSSTGTRSGVQAPSHRL